MLWLAFEEEVEVKEEELLGKFSLFFYFLLTLNYFMNVPSFNIVDNLQIQVYKG